MSIRRPGFLPWDLELLCQCDSLGGFIPLTDVSVCPLPLLFSLRYIPFPRAARSSQLGGGALEGPSGRGFPLFLHLVSFQWAVVQTHLMLGGTVVGVQNCSGSGSGSGSRSGLCREEESPAQASVRMINL